jgi:N-acetylneuraminate synthase
VKSFGFSGHHKDIAIDVVAYTSGATWIEKHFTLDKTWKGTDRATSFKSDRLRKLKDDLHAAYEALKFKKIDFSEVEKKQATKLRWDRDRIKNSNNNNLNKK